jgi:hypothetical protein
LAPRRSGPSKLVVAAQLAFDFARGALGAPARAKPGFAAKPAPKEANERATVLAERLADVTGKAIRLTVTDNRRTMLSVRRREGRLDLRVHHMFLHATDRVVRALARYVVRRDRRAGGVLDEFIAANHDRIGADARRPAALRSDGAVYDLREILEHLARSYFDAEELTDVEITWGRRAQMPRRRRRRTIQLGTYMPEDRLIRVHPVLDQAWVPRFYVETVVFHELLHHAMPAVVRNGRHCYHTAAFRKRERAFPHHERAIAWEHANLDRLLRSS